MVEAGNRLLNLVLRRDADRSCWLHMRPSSCSRCPKLTTHNVRPDKREEEFPEAFFRGKRVTDPGEREHEGRPESLRGARVQYQSPNLECPECSLWWLLLKPRESKTYYYQQNDEPTGHGARLSHGKKSTCPIPSLSYYSLAALESDDRHFCTWRKQ